MGGPFIDPESELKRINELLDDAEDELDGLLKKAREYKFISKIEFKPADRKLVVTECFLPDDLDADHFAYREVPREFAIPQGKNGKSIKGISCAKSVDNDQVTITVAYDDETSDTATFVVADCRGPQGQQGDSGKDLNQQPNDAYRYPGATFSSSSNGQLNGIASTAGMTASATGVSASVTGAAIGVTALSIGGNLSYTSADVVYTYLGGFKRYASGYCKKAGIADCLGYAVGLLVPLVNIGIGVYKSKTGALKRETDLFKTRIGFGVRN